MGKGGIKKLSWPPTTYELGDYYTIEACKKEIRAELLERFKNYQHASTLWETWCLN